MLTDRQIDAGAKALAADMALPGGGRKKLARLVADHLGWFDAVEARGLTWGDMSRLLFAAGVHGPGGRPIPVGTLSSTVWRKRQDAASAPALALPRTDRQSRNNESVTPDREGARQKRVPVVTYPEPSSRSRHPMPKATKLRPTKPPASGQSTSTKEQTLAFMQRAATLRRRRTD